MGTTGINIPVVFKSGKYMLSVTLMKKIFLTLLVIICVTNYIFSQTVSMDETFGKNETNYWVTKRITFDRQDNIFALGYAPEVLKTNANGTINSNFGENGVLFFNGDQSYITETVLQNGNNLLISNDNKFFSINNNGSLDTDFNNSGSFVLESFFEISDIKKQSSNLCFGVSTRNLLCET